MDLQMDLPLLIMNVQVLSVDMNARLTSKEGILRYEKDTIIRIPVGAAKATNGGPIVGERYYIRYEDGIDEEYFPPEFRYVGMKDKQLVFSKLSRQAAY